MDEVQVRARCLGCGRGLGFDEWSRGLDRCPYCLSVPNRKPNRAPARAAARSSQGDRSFDTLVDDVPEDLLDELVAMLEAEVERRPSLAQRRPTTPPMTSPAMVAGPAGRVAAPQVPEIAAPPPHANGVREVLDDIGIGRSPREMAWAAWGFALGFTANVALAKYAQVSTNAPMSEFFTPMLIGGLVAGATSAAIGWGLAKVLDRS